MKLHYIFSGLFFPAINVTINSLQFAIRESAEKGRIVTVKYLDPGSIYEVRKTPSGELVVNSTGKELAATGLKVVLEKKYDGSLYEIIRKANNK